MCRIYAVAPPLSYNGVPRITTSAPSKFLGQTLGDNSRSTRSPSYQKITEKIYSALNQIDQIPIRGEYKVWIYKFSVVPSLFFNLAFDRTPESTINKFQTRASSFLNCRLNIPKCATLASIFRREVTYFPYLPHVHQMAKLRLLASVHVLRDLNLKEMQGQISDPDLGKKKCIPPGCLDMLPAYPSSTPPTISVHSLMKFFNNTLIRQHTNHWNSLTLFPYLSNQSSWILSVLRMKLVCGSDSCFLSQLEICCSLFELELTTFKYQSMFADGISSLTLAAPSASLDIVEFTIFSTSVLQLSTKNDTHGAMIHSFLTHLSKILNHNLLEEATLYTALPGFRASDNPTFAVPISLVPTTVRPDIVIIHGKNVQYLELTVPINTKDGLQATCERKQSKLNYIALINDFEAMGFSAKLNTLEVGSLVTLKRKQLPLFMPSFQF